MFFRVAKMMVMVAATLPVVARAQFTFEDVIERARALAAQSYQAPTPVPKFMRDMSYHAYQGMIFDPQQTLWNESHSNFQVMLVPAGLYYAHPVAINIVDAEGEHRLPFEKSRFMFNDQEVQKLVPADLGYAGFKLTFPLRGAGELNQFLVFAGASYLRGVGRNDNFGLSARGLAINTGLASGEKFPSFTEFWVVRPSAKANSMMIYALLDGENITGAYRYRVIPGDATKLVVDTVLFQRQPIELLGVAPLTSMFFYGENSVRPVGEWRPEVHDSDGLLLKDGSGELVWRPLINPQKLEMDFFQVDNVRGFGLVQRDSAFSSYEDLEARYNTRPSAWVEPASDWGKGEVALIQLPSKSETNDNTVAFWRPAGPGAQAAEQRFSYTMQFGPAAIAAHPLGKVINTFIGHGDRIGGGSREGAYRFIVDFSGDRLKGLAANTPVVAQVTVQSGAELIEQFVEYNAPCGCWRLSILAKPERDKSLSLRAALVSNGEVLSETWDYRLPPENDLIVKK
jgi:glucans biosynthesis protein